MKLFIGTLLLLPMAAAAQTQSLEVAKPVAVERIPTHTPEWTNPNDSDPGTTDSVATDLQKIVVLCATEPQSPDLNGQWTAWIRRNYESGMDIDAVIDDVMRRALSYRAQQKREARARRLAVDDAATRKMMHDAAMNAVRNMK